MKMFDTGLELELRMFYTKNLRFPYINFILVTFRFWSSIHENWDKF